jgi:hypothetical protein
MASKLGRSNRSVATKTLYDGGDLQHQDVQKDCPATLTDFFSILIEEV